MTNATETGLDLATGGELLSAYLDQNTPAMLWGAPGIGKSELVAAAAQERGIGLIDLRISTLDSVDFRGLPHVEKGRALWSIPDFFPIAERDGAEGILFLDEINQGNRDTFAACYQLILNRRVGPHKLLDGWRIVAAGNRMTDRASAVKMPTALNNRLAHLDLVPDVDAWCKWAKRTGIPPLLIAFVMFRPHLLHVMPGGDLGNGNTMPDDARAFPTPRQWVEASKHFSADAHLRPRLVSGLVSEGPALEAEGFIKTWLELPKLQDILDDPSRARVPNGNSAKGALANGLAAMAKPVNVAPILEYAERLGKEFDFVTGKRLGDITPALKETAPYVAWCNRHQDSI